MQQRAISYQQKVTVQAPPYDLADGRFEVRSAVLRALFVVSSLAGAAIASWVALLLWPEYGPPNAAQWVGLGLCSLAGGFLLFFGWKSGRLMLRGWDGYQDFLERSRDAYLDAYVGADGQEVVQTVRAEEINVKDIRDALTLVCYIYLTGKTTLSGMRGPLLVSDGKRYVRVGALSDYGAEQAGRALEELGVLINVGQGRGRQLRQGSLEELVLAVVRGWKHSEE